MAADEAQFRRRPKNLVVHYRCMLVVCVRREA